MGLGSCYGFDDSCFTPKPSTCTDARPAAQVCAPTETWFWAIAAVVGVLTLISGRRGR